jgi:NAD(P)-dependent dehydrogenase (short-subunit alcohol dehydrogenase family)
MTNSVKIRGAVLITGASSGIGRASALALDAYGFKVFAGVRKQIDADALRQTASERLTPLVLEVTDAASIATAVEQITQSVGDAGLAGLVNNAGVTTAGPLEYLPLADLQRQFDINVVGPLALIQACLPLIRKAHGRIINISSVGGKLAMPFNGAYSATKFGVEALSDALRRELAPWDIHVSVVEPGLIATPMGDKLVRDTNISTHNWPPEAHRRYGKAFEACVHTMVEHSRAGSSPSVVADAIVHALISTHPRTRYAVGTNARRMTILARLLPDRILDYMLSRFFGLPRKANGLDEAAAYQASTQETLV